VTGCQNLSSVQREDSRHNERPTPVGCEALGGSRNRSERPSVENDCGGETRHVTARPEPKAKSH